MIYQVQSQEAYDVLMVHLESLGYKWRNGDSLVDCNFFPDMQKNEYIVADGKYMSVSIQEKKEQETEKTEDDKVNHPNHYKQYSQEVIDTIEEVSSQYPGNVGYSVGNAIKYIFRAPFKGNNVEDLKKAVWYLNRAIEKLEE